MIIQHMLFVEDEPSVQANVVDWLKQQFPDYKVEGVSTVNEAKATIRGGRKRGLITRVVIVDEVLPDGRGSELLKYLQKQYPGIKKIMLAALAKTEDLSRAINYGNLDKYILKDDFAHDHNLLSDSIRDTLEGEKDFVYEAIAEVLKSAEEEGVEEEAILVSGRAYLTPAELLRQITMETKLGRKHMKDFSKLLYNAFLRPEDFLTELDKRVSSRKKSKKKSSKKRRKSL